MRLLRLVGILLLAAPVSVGAQAPEPSIPESVRAASRFEGYFYLDVDGKPLPIQSDAEIEEFLAGAELGEIAVIDTGVTRPRKVVLLGNGFRAHAIFKDVDDRKSRVTEIINGRSRFSMLWRDWHGYDVAAYRLDRLLGLDRVPPAVGRTVLGDEGTIRIWLENTVTEVERSRDFGMSPPDGRRWTQQRSMVQVFDNLVANRDSNLGNLLIDPNWRLWFIDCSRCFGLTENMYYPLEHIDHCERGFWEGLEALDRASVERGLSPLLGRAEIDALMARRDLLVEHFRKLIDRKGETGVLFDVVPSTGRAPWAGSP